MTDDARRAALERGRGAIVLVPEIALTPQTVGRFTARFGQRIAILHSALSEAERRDERDARGSLKTASGPGALGGELVDPLRHHAALASAVSRDVATHRQRRQLQARREYRVAGAALREPVELPLPHEHAPCRHQNRYYCERYVPALHNASFSTRERRRIAASRFNALPRSDATS